MKISINWLKDILPLKADAQEIADRLSVSGLEVEHIEAWQSLPGGLKGFVIGEVLTCEQHPNADRLRVTTVNVGHNEPLHIVCGAPNVAAGQKVVVATVGTEIKMPGKEPFVIAKSKIRGEVSEGMICAEDEMGMGTNHDGILVLPESAQVGQSAADYFGVVNDTVLEIGLTANRGDAASHLGVARDLAGLFEYPIPQKDKKTLTDNPAVKSVTVESAELSHQYIGIEIQGVNIAPSPDWLKFRLKSIGIEPKNNVVDATNFVLHHFGQPVHAFDADSIGNDIRVRLAKSEEVMLFLDGTERELSTDDIVIADNNGPIALAGVMGGKLSAVTETTKNLFLEVAHFHPGKVRKSAKRHVVNTDASFRFERGIDQDNLTNVAAELSHLIVEVAGGTISGVSNQMIQPRESVSIDLNIQTMNAFAGMQIPENIAITILQNLGFEISGGLGLYVVKVPGWRNDVSIAVDLYEEVMRIYGFDQIEFSGKMQVSLGNFEGLKRRKLENKLRTYLVSQGVFEASTNSLTSNLWWPNDESLVELSNPLSSDMGIMRKSLIPGLLHSVAFNRNRQAEKVWLFELGRSYEKSENGFKETPLLSMVFWGKNKVESWESPQENTGYFDIKQLCSGLIQSLASSMSIDDITIELVSKDWLKKADIQGTVWSLEIPLKKLLKQGKKELKYQPPAKFPSMRRDLSLVVDSSLPFAELMKIVKSQKIGILKDTKVFDIFEGKPLEDGKKAVALSFVLSKPESSLTDHEADAAMQKLMSAFEQSGASIRR